MDENVKQQWTNVMDPERLKPNLGFIALYITLYEMLEDNIIQKPRDFFTLIDEIDEAEYKANVLVLYKPERCPLIRKSSKVLISSLLWWNSLEAISDDDIKVFSHCKEQRNTLTHEMFKIIAEGLDDGFFEDFVRMYALFCKIEKWWIINYEIPLNPDFDDKDIKDIDEDGVMSGNMVVLSAIMDIVSTGSNKHYEEVCKKMGIEVKGC